MEKVRARGQRDTKATQGLEGTRRVCNSSYHDIEGGDHIEGGRKYGTHGLHRWLVQAVIGRQDLAV